MTGRQPSPSVHENLTEQLVPCPFCGGEASDAGEIKYSAKLAQEDEHGQSTFFYCNCIVCGADNKGVVGHRTKADAVDAWNRRTPSPQSHLRGIEAFERSYPELFYKIGKGRISPDEPIYGAIIEMADGEPIGQGESNVSLEAAFEAALADSELPTPAGYPTVSKEEVILALHTLMRTNGHDLDRWTNGVFPTDELTEAYRAALATTEGLAG